MRNFFVGTAILLASNVALAQGAIGNPSKPAVFHISPYAGYMVYGDHFETGSGIEFSNDNAALFGVQAGFDLSRNFSLVGNFGYSKTRWEFESGGAEAAAGDVGIWLYDGNVQLRVPMGGAATTFSPFVQAGVGAIRFTTDDNDFNSTGDTNIAYNVGFGADLQFMGFGIRAMAKDYISSFAWDDIEDSTDPDEFGDSPISHNWAISLGLKFGF